MSLKLEKLITRKGFLLCLYKIAATEKHRKRFL